MSILHSWIENMWWSQSPPALLLRLIEPLYACISNIQLNRRSRRTIEPALPMISVGNITVGGSGKTPFVLWLAGILKRQGYAPVILCRGDGGSNTFPIVLGADSDAAIVGDEAKMLSDVSGCPVIAATDRIAGSRLAAGLGDILILDDGFQYRHLGRCCDIVLVPAEGIGNGHLIPAGPLREPVETLMRADIIVRTGNRSQIEVCQPLTAQRQWQWISETAGLIDVMDSGADRPETVYGVTAIARPQRFFDDLKASGLSLSGSTTYPDHHRFTPKEVDDMLGQQVDIAVTAKDAVKLAPLWPKQRPLWLLKLHGAGEPGLAEAIGDLLPAKENPASKDGAS